MATNENPDFMDDEEEEEGELISQDTCNAEFLEAARTNNVEELEKWISKKADINYMKDGWNAILWAACNGNEQIIRILI